MSNEDIMEEIKDFAYDKTEELSDKDYMEVLSSVAGDLQGSVNAREEELGI